MSVYCGPTRLVLAFDLGTTHSGVSYSILENGQPRHVYELARFPGQDQGVVGAPLRLSEMTYSLPRWKLHLGPPHLAPTSIGQGDYRYPLPQGKTAVDILSDFIKYLFNCVKNYIEDRHSAVKWSSLEDSTEFVFTHPNGWEGAQRQQYRRAIERAGLVPDTPQGRSRVRMITECEAVLHYYVSTVSSSTDMQHIVIIDAGGGTIDLSMYNVTENRTSCMETAPSECLLKGSMSVKMLRSSPPLNSSRIRKDALDAITHAFERQRKASSRKVNVVFLIGGFSMNKGFQTALKSHFEAEGVTLCCTADHVVKAVSTGAVLSHIDRKRSQPLVTSRLTRAVSSKFHPMFPSAARDSWQDEKHAEGAQNKVIDEIMDMIGLEPVKEKIVNIKNVIDIAKRQGTPVKKECFNLLLSGNPGTGKTTVARLYRDFLVSVCTLPGDAFIETSGESLSHGGEDRMGSLVEKARYLGGGVIFIDDVSRLLKDGGDSCKKLLDYLLYKIKNNTGTIAFIISGSGDLEMMLLRHDLEFLNYFPYQLHFPDYTYQELMLMFQDLIRRHYNGWIEVEGGIDGLFVRVAIKRLVRESGKKGFGNIHALETLFLRIRERQVGRLARERKMRMQVDDFLLTKEDLIGPDPSKVLCESAPWKKLQGLIGLESVKTSVRELFLLVETNYRRELAEKEPLQISLNRVFLGSPGTGKTSVAKLYGQILADLGMLSKGQVVVKNPSDFIGEYIGESEKNTNAILESARGNVLVIDEAYMLYSNGKMSSFNIAVVDTMVAKIQNVPGEDRCVLLLGYKDQMEDMFQNVNPGLARRFSIENAFNFEDFTEPQLMQILELKLREQDLYASEEAKRVAGEVLNRLRVRPNFGNAGEVDNLLGLAKARYQRRASSVPAWERMDITFEPQDFDPDFSRSQVASENLDRIFADIVGCAEVKRKLDGYQRVAFGMKRNGLDMNEMRDIIPTAFVFKGPPGTGKTMIARKVGQVYYDMGFLASAEIVECSTADLIEKYVGHTGPKVKSIFEKALGKVLFIDEAYRLSKGDFAQEATEEIVGLMTNERFMGKLIVVLAGYEKEMNNLIERNSGLSSRFSEEITFRNLTSVQCLELLDRELRKKRIDVSELREEASGSYAEMKSIIDRVMVLPSWGNARDIKTLGKRMVSQAYANMTRDGQRSFSAGEARRVMEGMLQEQQARQNTSHTTR